MIFTIDFVFQVVNQYFALLEKRSFNIQFFSTHAFHSGESVEVGHDPESYAHASHLERLENKQFLLFPIYAVGCSGNAGHHLYLMLADRKLRTVRSYCINNTVYDLQG